MGDADISESSHRFEWTRSLSPKIISRIIQQEKELTGRVEEVVHIKQLQTDYDQLRQLDY